MNLPGNPANEFAMASMGQDQAGNQQENIENNAVGPNDPAVLPVVDQSVKDGSLPSRPPRHVSPGSLLGKGD